MTGRPSECLRTPAGLAPTTLDLLHHHLLRLELLRKFGSGGAPPPASPGAPQDAAFATLRSLITSGPAARCIYILTHTHL